MRRSFRVMTGNAGRTTTLSPPLLSAAAVSSDMPVMNDAGSGRGCLDVACVAVIPPPLRAECAGQVHPRRRRYYADTQKVLKQQQQTGKWGGKEGGEVSIAAMKNAGELRFPCGRNVRQSLTLRNTAKECLQNTCGGLQRPRHHRQRLFKWLHLNVLFLARCRDLAADALCSSATLFASYRLVPPDCREKKKKRRECDILLPPALLPPVSSVVPFASPFWQPLAQDEMEEDYCSKADFTLCPQRVFSREVELESFLQLQERRVGRRCDVAGTKCNENYSGEEWLQEAFLHDVQTMAGPYREVAAIVDDAKLHYCYRLALYRERRRLGL